MAKRKLYQCNGKLYIKDTEGNFIPGKSTGIVKAGIEDYQFYNSFSNFGKGNNSRMFGVSQDMINSAIKLTENDLERG